MKNLFFEKANELISREADRQFTKSDLDKFILGIRPSDRQQEQATIATWNNLCKPLYGLGILEGLSAEIAGMQRKPMAEIRPAALFCFVGDNGIVEEGVSQSGQEVTSQVLINMSEGKSTVSIYCDHQGVDFYPVNLGTSHYRETRPGILDYPICPKGTKNFLNEPAMNPDQCLQAIGMGIKLAKLAADQGYKLLMGGEMGIGNTTTSTTLACLLGGLDPATVTGRGAGLSDQGLDRKKEVIGQALIKYASLSQDPLGALGAVGGLDIAGLCGLYLGAAHYHIPIILDGLITYAAALVACQLAPMVKDYLVPSHLPKEPAGRAIAEILELKPSLDFELKLGEGAGALFLLPILEMTILEFHSMPSWDEGQVEAYEDYAVSEGQN